MHDIRTVIDTSVAVSAVLLSRSVPRQAFDAAAIRGKLLVSESTVAELDEVLRRAKFNKYIPEESRLEFLAALVQVAEQVEITEVISVCRDAKDNKFLELAVSGAATHLVTGDDDLLALHPLPRDCRRLPAGVSGELAGEPRVRLRLVAAEPSASHPQTSRPGSQVNPSVARRQARQSNCPASDGCPRLAPEHSRPRRACCWRPWWELRAVPASHWQAG